MRVVNVSSNTPPQGEASGKESISVNVIRLNKKAGHGFRIHQGGFTWHYLRVEEDDEDEKEK